VSEDQYKSVSKVLMTNASYETAPQAQQGEATVQQENLAVIDSQKKSLAVHAKLDGGMCLSRVFGDMTNCSIAHITVNVNPGNWRRI